MLLPGKFTFKEGRVRPNSNNLIVQAYFTSDAAFTKINNGSETMISLPSGGVESTGRLSNQLKELSKI